MVSKSPLQQHGTGLTVMVRVLIAVLVVVAGYLVFEFGRIRAGYDIIDAAVERQAFAEHVQQLDERILDLKQQVALLKTHSDVNREAYKEVETSLVGLQAKIQEQQDDIAFYQGIISPADGKAGLRVQDLKLTRGAEERNFNVRLVLVQAKKHDRKVSGNVELTVKGSQDGAEKSYTLTDLMPADSDKDWSFSFRYFRNFNRQLVLPDGFTPEQITVEVHSKTRSIDSIEQSFAWATSRG